MFSKENSGSVSRVLYRYLYIIYKVSAFIINLE